MTPGKERVHTPHFGIKAVVSFVAYRYHAVNATGRLANDFSQFGDSFVAADVLRVANPFVLPGVDNLFINISAGDAKGAEEIAFAAFIDAQPRREQLRI